MNEPAIIYSGTIQFSYSQFHVFDSVVELPGCAWTEAHSRQGFARRDSAVNFGTILEFGYGDVVARSGPYVGNQVHERVIEVPIEVSSGEVVIAGPEEYPEEHVVKMPKGHYRLVAAQTVKSDARESIDLYFEKVTSPLRGSTVIVADDALDLRDPLLESAETA